MTARILAHRGTMRFSQSLAAVGATCCKLNRMDNEFAKDGWRSREITWQQELSCAYILGDPGAVEGMLRVYGES